jgi:hypothetical protein
VFSNKEIAENIGRKPIFTNISLGLTIVGNLIVWPAFAYSVFKKPNDGMFDLMWLILGGYFFFYVDLASILTAVIATLRKESKQTRRQKAYMISIFSLVAFFVLLQIVI